MQGKKILLAVTGSIAAYKIPILVRLLKKSGAEVKVIMTASAKDFVSDMVLSTLSQNVVMSDIHQAAQWNNHVELSHWADIMLIAPASCNTIAKMAHGICDNLVMAVYMSARCKIMILPAMDHDMYEHSATQNNIQSLKSFGHILIEPSYGELASGLIGKGRMPEPEEIFEHLKTYFTENNLLQNYKAIVTAGPTYENIDPVRFIGNYSSGKMGIAIAETLANKGCEVHLICGPIHQVCNHPKVIIHNVISAQQMYEKCNQLFPNVDIAIMSAAVADFTPTTVAKNKIKKSSEHEIVLTLEKTKDILKHLGSIKNERQFLVGFALETENEEENAMKKLTSKNADIIILNSLNEQGAGFAHDTNKVIIIEKNGNKTYTELMQKKEIANTIVNKIINVYAK